MEKKTIGSLIAALRKAKGMTQKDLAERLHVSDKSVSRWERDEGVPDLSLIPVIAEIFGITCDELLKGECNSNPSDQSTDKDTLSPKGEKECKRILQSKMNFYQILSFVGIGITLLGLLTNFVFNLNIFGYFIGSGIAFFISTILYLGSAVLQVILVFIAFMSVSNNGLDPAEIKLFKYRVIRQAEINFGFIAVCFSYGLPYSVFSVINILKLPIHVGIRYGIAAAVLTGILFCILCYFINAFLIRKGICGMKEEKLIRYWHNHKLKRKMVIFMCAAIVFTVLLQNIVTCFGNPYYLSKGTKFQDYESFTNFMELEIPIPYQYHDEAYQASNTIVYLKNFSMKTDTRKKLFQTTLRDAEGNNRCEYMDANYSVCAIQYMEKKDTILPITVITYEEFDKAKVIINVLEEIFKFVYVFEVIVFLLLYFRKRAK